jgi:hypothetical protein
MNWIWHVVQTLTHGRENGPEGESLVFAVTNCYPTRIALYAAAFQGNWKIVFMKSLREVQEAVRARKPRAIFFEHSPENTDWDRHCSAFATQDIPFILLAHRNCDETFLVLLAHGGYHAWGNPLTSENIVNAVDLAEEVAADRRKSPLHVY